VPPTVAHGKICYIDTPEVTARFRDPGGNVLGVYQHPSR
jgi:hypothetical protein